MPIPVIAVAAAAQPTPTHPIGPAPRAAIEAASDEIPETTLYVISAIPIASTPEAIASKLSTTNPPTSPTKSAAFSMSS